MSRPLVRYLPLEYRIAVHSREGWLVDGFAVELPPDLRWVHICVRKGGPRDWCIDHFETGLSMNGPLIPVTAILTREQQRFFKRYEFDRTSRGRAVASAIRWMRFLDRRGLLRPKIKAAMRGRAGPSIPAALGIKREAST